MSYDYADGLDDEIADALKELNESWQDEIPQHVTDAAYEAVKQALWALARKAEEDPPGTSVTLFLTSVATRMDELQRSARGGYGLFQVAMSRSPITETTRE